MQRSPPRALGRGCSTSHSLVTRVYSYFFYTSMSGSRHRCYSCGSRENYQYDVEQMTVNLNAVEGNISVVFSSSARRAPVLIVLSLRPVACSCLLFPAALHRGAQGAGTHHARHPATHPPPPIAVANYTELEDFNSASHGAWTDAFSAHVSSTWCAAHRPLTATAAARALLSSTMLRRACCLHQHSADFLPPPHRMAGASYGLSAYLPTGTIVVTKIELTGCALKHCNTCSPTTRLQCTMADR